MHVVAEVKTDFLEGAARTCQLFAGQLAFLFEPRQVPRFAERLTDRLPEPDNRAEDLLLQRMLVEVADKVERHMHRWSHAGGESRFAREHLDHFWSSPHRPSKRVFAEWATALASAFADTYPPSQAEQAASAIREHSTRTWRVTELAALVGISPAQLRRAFFREHRMRLPEYQRRVRMLRAIEQIAANQSNIESVARDVGYRSKKNFYRSFRKLVGFTPTEFRQLPSRRKRDVIESTMLSLVPSCFEGNTH
jgi:methylphosphotriester-DNA--protein-cysteine methyltransferase